MENLKNKRILFIAGQPKAGTTSLFDWLSQHPQTSAGKLKELRFFLDPDYPLDAPARFDGKNLDEYLTLFKYPEKPVLLDATPDYIGCRAPLHLPSLHPDSKAVIIIRDPVERMISAYRFFQARGMVPPAMTFDEYVQKQHNDGVSPTTEVQWRALDHCRTDHYIRLWREAFGDNLMVLEFDVLRRDSKTVAHKICNFVGLEMADDIDIGHSNKTQSYKNPNLFWLYSSLRRWVVIKTINNPMLHRSLRPIGQIFRSLISSSKDREARVSISDEARTIIQAYKLKK